MPLKRLNYTLNFIKPHVPSFILLLFLVWVLDYLNEYSEMFQGEHRLILVILGVMLTVIINGYGLCVSKEILNNRDALPKLEFFKSLIFGIKFAIVTSVYSTIQFFILFLVSIMFNFPIISAKEGRIMVENFGSLFYYHSAADTILFIIFVIATFYIYAFFLEIALARLADKGKIMSALNLNEIKRCIDTIGWSRYTADYTKLILAIGILAYIKYGIDLFLNDDSIFDMVIWLLIFIIQFIGIGMIYRTYKNKSSNLKEL